MASRLVFLVLGGALVALPSHADTVLLKNGRTLEGVIAEEAGTVVEIRMAGATLSLPAANVLRIEKGEAPFAVFQERKAALRKDPAAGAAAWLDLATWARRNELDKEAREAALTAADLDPRLPALQPMMRILGYTFDGELERYIPYADAMRRKGMVLSDGQWISREEHRLRTEKAEREAALREAERAEQAARRAEARRDADLARERELLRLERERLARQQAASGSPALSPVYVVPGYYVSPIFVGPPAPQSPEGGHRHGSRQPSSYDSLLTRQPGSLLPGLVPNAPPRHYSSSRRRQ